MARRDYVPELLGCIHLGPPMVVVVSCKHVPARNALQRATPVELEDDRSAGREILSDRLETIARGAGLERTAVAGSAN